MTPTSGWSPSAGETATEESDSESAPHGPEILGLKPLASSRRVDEFVSSIGTKLPLRDHGDEVVFALVRVPSGVVCR